MKLKEIRAVWLQTGQFGLAVELEGPQKANCVGRIRLLPGDPADKVVAALRQLADIIETTVKNHE